MATCEFNIADSYAESGAWSYQPCGKQAIEVWDKIGRKWAYLCAEHLECLNDLFDIHEETITTMERKEW